MIFIYKLGFSFLSHKKGASEKHAFELIEPFSALLPDLGFLEHNKCLQLIGAFQASLLVEECFGLWA